MVARGPRPSAPRGRFPPKASSAGTLLFKMVCKEGHTGQQEPVIGLELALAADMAPDRQTGALILMIAGGIMLIVIGVWSIRRLDNYYRVKRREHLFVRVSKYDRQLAQLESELRSRLEELKKESEEKNQGTQQYL